MDAWKLSAVQMLPHKALHCKQLHITSYWPLRRKVLKQSITIIFAAKSINISLNDFPLLFHPVQNLSLYSEMIFYNTVISWTSLAAAFKYSVRRAALLAANSMCSSKPAHWCSTAFRENEGQRNGTQPCFSKQNAHTSLPVRMPMHYTTCPAHAIDLMLQYSSTSFASRFRSCILISKR